MMTCNIIFWSIVIPISLLLAVRSGVSQKRTTIIYLISKIMLESGFRGSPPGPLKKAWSDIIWNKAWQIDDLFWESTMILHKNNEVLHSAMSRSRYLSWWELSDKFPHLIRICENMAKLLSGASRLKCDDTRLKGLTQSFRNCSRCDMYTAENLHHLVMQCPATDTIRRRNV